jgi:predicted RNA-binding protein YlxR (DUF448 family)
VSELVRVVKQGGAIVPDLTRQHPGRGAHLCPTLKCLDAAVKKRSFGRALRGRVDADRSVIAEALAKAFWRAEQELERSPRVSQAKLARRDWFAAGLREFTLRIPGAMNRGLASDGVTVTQNMTPVGVVGAHE